MPNGSGGWTEKKLHNFPNGTDAAYPIGGLIFDAAGSLYGTTEGGGNYGYGTVFELTPTEGGGWTEKKLYNFRGGTDGSVPIAGLIFDAAGNLYGTTYYGGDHDAGAVFELTPREGGGWTEKVLRSFDSAPDGAYPSADLIFDAAGNLYGTTYGGGDYGVGTVFELTPKEGGDWTEKNLHNFGNGGDGTNPYAGLVFDAAGNLYGTTYYGGDHDAGTVFELMPREGEGWAERKIHNFGSAPDGAYPYAGLIFDAAGNLYGTTTENGSHPCNGGLHCGTVFELTPGEGGGWTEKKLHSFGNGTDGTYPRSGVIFDAAGNLYGTTYLGGDYPCDGNGCGTVFEIIP